MSCIAAVLADRDSVGVRQILSDFDHESIVVIDNGSSEPLLYPTPIIRFPDKVDFAFAWNRAMPFLAKFDYVWMLKPNTTDVSRGKMLQLYNVINFLQAHVLTPSFKSDYKELQPRADGLGVRRISWLEWQAPIVSTKWWFEMSGFDPFFTTPNGATLELCYRARAKGHASLFVSDAVEIKVTEENHD